MCVEVSRVAPRLLISNKQRIIHQFEVRDENPLYVLLDPEMNTGVKDLSSPQFFSSGGVGGYNVLISSITLGRIPDSIGNDRSDGLRWYPLCHSSRRH